MYACAPSPARSIIFAVLATIPCVVLVATRTAGPGAPALGPPPLPMPMTELHVSSTASAMPPCEHWAEDFSLRDAMQICSTWADLETNEHWMFGVRAQIVQHRVVGMSLMQIDHDCDACFDREADGRAERERYTLASVTTCMREQLEKATFIDDTCVLDTRWAIKNDW